MSEPAQESQELAAILDTMADGLFVIDAAHRIRRWNAAMERLTGYAAAEVMGQACTMLCAEGGGPGSGLGMVDQALSEAGYVRGQEMLIRRKDGKRTSMLVNARRFTGMGAAEAVITLTDLSNVRRLEEENQQLREQLNHPEAFHDIVGQSHKIREVFRLVELAAQSDETILVQGETGTGKELVARAIHRQSHRHAGPMVTVNCSALSESLLESELFGHAKGAFTGAVRDHVGRFESASGGTVFLDEVGELTPLVQVKLLRVLQEHTIERVGEGASRTVDVRVIAATHRDLRERVREGAFREDLFYRLNVFPVRIPPLRERREDIEPLLNHFVARAAKRTGKTIEGCTPDAMRILMEHCWPGNVRELENAVAHAFITCPEGPIGPFDLPLEIRQVELRDSICGPLAGTAPAARAASASTKRRKLTRQQILDALEQAGWNKAEAARIAGVDRTTLWRRMKALDIPMDPEG